jgi:hypothetical protein
MKKYVLNEEAYLTKMNFVHRHCLYIESCRKCHIYNNKKGCQHPDYVKQRLLKEIDSEDENSQIIPIKPEPIRRNSKNKPRVNYFSYAFDAERGRFRVRINNPDIRQKAVCFCKNEESAEEIIHFLHLWPVYIVNEEEYAKMKAELINFREENELI